MQTGFALRNDYEISLASNLPVVSSKMLQNYFLKAEHFEDEAKETYDDRNGKFFPIISCVLKGFTGLIIFSWLCATRAKG